LGDGILSQFAEERSDASDPELDINAVSPDINRTHPASAPGSCD
jgi:hypothetical protein